MPCALSFFFAAIAAIAASATTTTKHTVRTSKIAATILRIDVPIHVYINYMLLIGSCCEI